MPDDPATAFLALARARRLLPSDELDALARPGELTPERLTEVTDLQLAAGGLTAYQARMLRAGRGGELVVAGYPVLDDPGDGKPFAAVHPSLGTPVSLRVLPPAAFASENARDAFVRRAQDASALHHPHLTTTLDAGRTPDGGAFVAAEAFDGGDLFTLVADIGPMPEAVACGYLRGVAEALRAAAARGLVHGDVRPQTLVVGPLAPMDRPKPDGTPRSRPTADAVVKLAGLGQRLPDGPAERPPFAAPERLSGEPVTSAADVYGLGATLYYLLGGREDRRAPLSQLRPDLPAALADAVEAMLYAEPAGRPSLDAVVVALGGEAAPPAAPPGPHAPLDRPAADALAALIDDALAVRVGSVADVSLDAPAAAPAPAEAVEHPLGRVESLEVLEGDAPLTAEEGFVPREYVPGESGESDFAVVPPVLDPAHPEALVADAPLRPQAGMKKSHFWLWVGVGAGLNLLAVLLTVVYLFVPFGDTKPTAPAPNPAFGPPKKGK